MALENLMKIEMEAPGFSAVRFNISVALARERRFPESIQWMERRISIYPFDHLAVRELVRLLGHDPESKDRILGPIRYQPEDAIEHKGPE